MLNYPAMPSSSNMSSDLFLVDSWWEQFYRQVWKYGDIATL